MQEIFVPRPSAYRLELALLPGKKLLDGGPAHLHLGKTGSLQLNLPARYFRLVYLLGVAWAVDEREGIPEDYRGFLSTDMIREAYAVQANNRIPLSRAAVITYMKAIRDTARDGATKLAMLHGISDPVRPLAVEHTKDGYRVGEISLRILDYRVDAPDLGALSIPLSM